MTDERYYLTRAEAEMLAILAHEFALNFRERGWSDKTMRDLEEKLLRQVRDHENGRPPEAERLPEFGRL